MLVQGGSSASAQNIDIYFFSAMPPKNSSKAKSGLTSQYVFPLYHIALESCMR